MKTFYHATSKENMVGILCNGLKAGNQGCVFMTEREDEAVRFLLLRQIPEIVTIKIKVYKKDYDKVHETFDHSQSFFCCRAFGYYGDISAENISASRIYKNPLYMDSPK